MAANESTRDTHFSNLDIGTTNGGGSIKVAGTQVIGSQGTAIADLNQDISATYVEAEVQAISDKVDVLLAMLRTHGIIAT